MAKVNWNEITKTGVVRAKSKGKEANFTQVRNALNDIAKALTEKHSPGEIVDAIYRLAGRKHRA